MPSYFGLKKIAWLGLAKNQKLLVIVQHMFNNVSKNYGPVKSIKIYSYFHLKCIFISFHCNRFYSYYAESFIKVKKKTLKKWRVMVVG
jgi:hypothetical protein